MKTIKRQLPPILVVDDDPLVLDTLRDLFESLDCPRQLRHPDTSSAFEATADPDVGLIICDYRFPGTSGISFIEQVRRRGIMTPVLFISGAPDKEAVVAAAHMGHTAFLGKPFTIARLKEAIFDLLDSTAGERTAVV